MTQKAYKRGPPDVPDVHLDTSRDQILTVGVPEEQAGSMSTRLFGALGHSTRSVDVEALSADILSRAMVVLSPVIGARHDAVEIAAKLHEHGYDGRFVVYAAGLPDTRLVEREVKAVAPRLSFDIVETGRGPTRTARQ